MIASDQQAQLQEEMDKIIATAHPFPMTARMAFKIYRAYGKESVKRVKQAPHLLSRDVFGIGEQTATEIAEVIESKYGTPCGDLRDEVNPKQRNFRGPGNGKLTPQNFKVLKNKLQSPPHTYLPPECPLQNPQAWTIADLKQAVKFWFNIGWAHDSSYRDLFKKCGFTYDLKEKIFIRREQA